MFSEISERQLIHFRGSLDEQLRRHRADVDCGPYRMGHMCEVDFRSATAMSYVNFFVLIEVAESQLRRELQAYEARQRLALSGGV